MNITSHIMVKNEQFWLPFVLGNLCQVFPKVLAADCGSQDSTVEILHEFKQRYPSVLEVFELGQLTPEQNGQVRQLLTDHTETEWAAITDGDEFYPLESLHALFQTELPDSVRMTYSTIQVVTVEGQKFFGREKWNKHVLFHVPSTTWRGAFPFEIPKPWIDSTDPATKYYYKDVFGYDFHHLPRSPRDSETPHRLRMDGIRQIMPIEQELPELDELLKGGSWSNPVLEMMRNK